MGSVYTLKGDDMTIAEKVSYLFSDKCPHIIEPLVIGRYQCSDCLISVLKAERIEALEEVNTLLSIKYLKVSPSLVDIRQRLIGMMEGILIVRRLLDKMK